MRLLTYVRIKGAISFYGEGSMSEFHAKPGHSNYQRPDTPPLVIETDGIVLVLTQGDERHVLPFSNVLDSRETVNAAKKGK